MRLLQSAMMMTILTCVSGAYHVSLSAQEILPGEVKPSQGSPQRSAPATAMDACAGSVYLNTSLNAKEALHRAERHIQLGKWPAASVAYQDIGEKFGRYLIRDGSNRFISVRQYVNERIAQWPPPGRAAYRAAYGAVAERSLKALGNLHDIEALIALADRYYPTSAGAKAMDAAAELAIEQGRFATARQWVGTLLATHPDRRQFARRWRAKLALCDAWEGDLDALNQINLAHPSSRPSPHVNWGGSNRSLRDFVRDMLEEMRLDPPISRQALTDGASPSIFCGGPARRAFFHSTAEAEARLWQFQEFGAAKPSTFDLREDSHIAGRDAFLRALRSGRLISSMPIYGEGLIFCHDAETVWAVDPDEASHAAWTFTFSPSHSLEPQWSGEDVPPDLFTALHADGKIFVALRRKKFTSATSDSRLSSTLICLDAKTGTVLWQNNLEGLASKFEDLLLDGAPLLHTGKLFAVARRRKAFGFEACLLLALDPKSGRLLWQTHLGEAPTGSYGYYRPTRTYPAASGDRVFVHTNLGTVVAVSASTGRVAWLICYPSRYADDSDVAWPTRFGRPIRSWQYQPTMLWRDSVICMPLDIEAILILNQSDGHIRRRLPLEKLGDPESILGLHGDFLYCISDQVVCYDLAAGKIAWQRPLAEGRLFGRGVVTSNGLFVPTDRSLLRYPLEGGAVQIYPWNIQQAGNLLALPDQIVVAASQSLYGLLRKQDAFTRLTLQMKNKPNDSQVAFALAELAFKTSEHRRGLWAVDQAVKRLGGFANLNDEHRRRDVFDRLVHFARLLLPSSANGQDSPDKDQIDSCVKLLIKAGQCVPDLQSQIIYRLIMARAQQILGKYQDAIHTYQQILGDRSLRRLPLRLIPDYYPPSVGSPSGEARDLPETTISSVIETWIHHLVIQHGPTVYREVELRAENRLTIALAESNPASILEVAYAFPNSRTAAKAFLTHAEMECKRKEWPAAIRSYRRLLTGHAEVDRPAILREYIFCLNSAGRDQEAEEWLERGIRDYPSYRFEHDSRRIGFEELFRMLGANRRTQHLAYPLMAWPLHDGFHRMASDRISILDPVFKNLPETGWNVYLSYAGGQIEAASTRNGQSLWPAPVPCPAQPVLLGMDKERFIFATAHRIFALTQTHGKLAWQFGSEPPVDPNADPESLTSWNDHILTENLLVITSDEDELLGLDPKDGNLLWHREMGRGAASAIAATDQRVFYTQWMNRQNHIHILDAQTGKETLSLVTHDVRPLQSLMPTRDGMLLAVHTRSLMLLHPETGEIRWRQSTPEHYLLSTLIADADGILISADGRSMSKYDIYTGKQTWQTPSIGSDVRNGLWAQIVGGRLIVASRNALSAFDTADGRILWKTRHPPGLSLQPPIIAEGSVITIAPKAPVAKHVAANAARAGADGDVQRYRIRRFSLSDGREGPVIKDGVWITESLESFGGLYVRNNCLLLLDDDRLIGYVTDVHKQPDDKP